MIESCIIHSVEEIEIDGTPTSAKVSSSAVARALCKRIVC